MAAVESMDGPEDEEDPEENKPLRKRSRKAPPDPTDSDDSDIETQKLVAENGVLSETEEEDDEDVPLLARIRSKRSCRITTPKPTLECGSCTFDDKKMMANEHTQNLQGRTIGCVEMWDLHFR
jgi:hypothetical protein